MVLPVRTYGDPVLRRKASAIESLTEEHKDIILNMKETMLKKDGIGLAAPQIALSERIIVINLSEDPDKPDPQVFFNPDITDTAGDLIPYEEGCLSIPGITGEVLRPEKITLKARNSEFREIIIENAEGMLARVLQHEIDHLNGVLFVDRLSLGAKSLIQGKLKKMARENR
ncbi:MAG: peptide deformylase [Fibrobacterota bacterium]